MRTLALVATVWLAACSQEPSFDERYEAAADQIGTSAKEIDDELEKRETEAKEIEPGEAPVPPPKA